MFLALHFTFQGRIYLPGYPLYPSLFQTSPGYPTSSTEFHGSQLCEETHLLRSPTLPIKNVTFALGDRPLHRKKIYDISSNHRTQILSSGPLKPNWEILHKI
ncbi:hypothetical protein I7I50_07994 [Histoplasma capsulatum G186AR]|uniref:Uncharacterized protein n=1 Tax=Ajellomyces capsulatus TaxID=5037 RepID=A0A8H8CVI2_AJECA|nr:hypothetical protein I7I52_08510 [Histoplasma capsulatum]QSS68547.1 hypothetical protein I7I50_07994 [Histoplasma capsulatum G186AR]